MTNTITNTEANSNSNSKIETMIREITTRDTKTETTTRDTTTRDTTTNTTTNTTKVKHPEYALKDSSGNRLKAQWKSVEQIEKLRQENRCFRCERRGCYARVCPLIPVGGIAYCNDVPRPKQPMKGPNGGVLRATWKSVEKIEELRMESRCFRCERQGCCTRYCRLLPAINPRFTKIPTLTSEIKSVAERVDDEGDADRINQVILGNLEVTDKQSSLDQKEAEDIRFNQEIRMNTNPFLVNALVNDVTMVQALVDNGCLCSGIIDDALTSELKLPRIPISPRQLETVEESSVDKP
ncbi:hypothetical protein K3495_g15941, partial [Podosphaera aphanis]